MRVKRNFDFIYRTERDPWDIGNADSARYNLYYDLVIQHSRNRKTLLDIGCGFGAFLSRFKDDFCELTGIEISKDAIQRGKERYPYIRYIQGSADHLDPLIPDQEFDTIIYSDVICYLTEAGKNSSLKWISHHLEKEGLGFIAAWCPGGKYLTDEELERLVKRFFKIEEKRVLESGHALFLARKKRYFVAVTVDYETWHPIPPGKKIDWEKDVFRPAEELLKLSDEEGVRLTLMAEMGEYFWLRDHDQETSRCMEEQWVEAVKRGHDVQLHLHPSWLPELGADCKGGEWTWDWSKAKADDYPGDLGALIRRCKSALESVIRTREPSYRVSCFRAGAYQVQPFKRLHDALARNGVFADSSTYAGGVSTERGYDFTLAYSASRPYFANPYDPQLKAPPAERALVEMPILTFNAGERWSLDGVAGQSILKQLFNYLQSETASFKTSESRRREKRIKGYLGQIYQWLKPVRRYLNRFLPKSVAHYMTYYGPESLTGHEYFVMTGHTKEDHDFAAVAEHLRALKREGQFEFLTLSQMAEQARGELLEASRNTPHEEACYQVQREYPVVMGDERNEPQSHYLQEMIPLDRNNVLDLGCGAGHWSARINDLYPWMTVAGLDYGLDFLSRAKDLFGSARVWFLAGDFLDLPFRSERFHSVYADNTLEHAFDVEKSLYEIFRVLRWDGVLIASIPADARNTRKICDNHVWKTAPHEVRMRLENAGFTNIEIHEIDVFRKLGMPPFPPANDRMMYIKAWKRKTEATRMNRAMEIMDWVYRNLNPEKSQESNDPVEILSRGYAFCWGYAVVLGKLLEREGFHVMWVSMLAKGHPKGRGEEKVESHEVVTLRINGRENILDPMTNTRIPYPLLEVLAHPELAAEKEYPDSRYIERNYRLYDTSFWYSRVFKYAIRSKVDQRWVRWRKNRVRG